MNTQRNMLSSAAWLCRLSMARLGPSQALDPLETVDGQQIPK